MSKLVLTAAFIATCVVGASQAFAQWGDLKVKFLYGGAPPAPAKLNANVQGCPAQPADESLLVDPNGGIANVIVYVRTKEVKIHPNFAKTANDTIVFDNKGCRFEPHVAVVRLTQTLELHNSDPISHNSNLQPLGNAPINPLLPGGGAEKYVFARALTIPVPVTCNIHPWMKGHILAHDNPYAAISAKDGTLEIKNLPTGELEFQAWHEKAGYLAVPNWTTGKFKMAIEEGANDLGQIKCAPALFK